MAAESPCSRKVLLVEEDAPARALLGEALGRPGCRVVTAAGGTAAAALAREGVDVIVLGLPLVGLGGPEFLEQLRQGLPGPPLLIVVGGETMHPGSEAPGQEAQPRLIKPPRGEEVALLLERLPPAPPAPSGPPRAELEARLRFCQQLALAGQVASGVAHDLNNLMTVLLGLSS